MKRYHQLINKLPNELRQLFKEIEAKIMYMESLEDAGTVTVQQREAFFELIQMSIPETDSALDF